MLEPLIGAAALLVISTFMSQHPASVIKPDTRAPRPTPYPIRPKKANSPVKLKLKPVALDIGDFKEAVWIDNKDDPDNLELIVATE